jgi:beta-galactosidase
MLLFASLPSICCSVPCVPLKRVGGLNGTHGKRITFLVFCILVLIAANAWAGPPKKKNKPNERHGRDMQVIDGAWQTLAAPATGAQTEGWERDVPKGAAETLVPSLQDPKTADTIKTPVWYWRRFDIPADWRGQAIRLRFEAVAENAQVWLNGQKLGEHAGGATPFEFTVTQTAHIGASNLLALRVMGGKWGTGLWQGVLLMAHDEAYLGDCFPQADAQGHVTASLDFLNTSKTAGDATLDARIASSKEPERAVQKTYQNLHVTPGRNTTSLLTSVGKKQLVVWSPDTPALYILQLIFRQEKDVLDTQQTAFGFREWDYKNGAVTLNGTPLTLKSLDYPTTRPTVIASVDDEGRLRAALRHLKENGVVLLHVNAPPPALLRLADEEGLLIVEGARTGQSRERAGEELRALVLRDRAHPSILGWNLFDADTVTTTALRALDPTRFLLVGTGTNRTLWPPNQNAPVSGSLPSGLLPTP